MSLSFDLSTVHLIFVYRILFLYIVQYNCIFCIVVQYHCHFLTQCNIITHIIMVHLSYAKVDIIQLQMMSVIWCDCIPVYDIH